MRLPPFRIEHFYARHEFTAEFMLSSSDAQSRSISELLALEPDARERFDAHWLGYTESPGSPEFRTAVSSIYQTMSPEDVLGVSSAEEGIFLLYNALLEPGDHVVVETPCYESALELAQGTGAQVSRWERRFEDGWAHDVNALERLMKPNTRLIYINTPHNPTGLNMNLENFHAVLNLARERGIIVFCDEVYRELEHDPHGKLPAACDLYERAVSLGSMSKAYGLAGLRLGWLAARDHTILERVLHLKYYTTICSSAPSEFLSALALRQRHAILERNLGIVQRNLSLLEAFMARRGDLFAWVKPNATTMGFPHLNVPDPAAFCEDVVRATSVLLLPGAVYDEPRHVRVGYGRENMPAALERLGAYLERR
jgi:aspartate/methionine/tyrosine aminotransferase